MLKDRSVNIRDDVNYSGRRKCHCLNNIYVVDFQGFIIYQEVGFVGSEHDKECAAMTDLV
jgi:hypothetical protein